MGVFQVHNGKTVEIPQGVLADQHEAMAKGGAEAGDAVVAKFLKDPEKEGPPAAARLEANAEARAKKVKAAEKKVAAEFEARAKKVDVAPKATTK